MENRSNGNEVSREADPDDTRKFRENEEQVPLDPSSEIVKKPKRSCGETLRNIFKNVTIEPSVMLYIIAFLISATTIMNLALEKACRVDLKLPREVCDAIRKQNTTSQNEIEREVQKLYSDAVAMKTYVSATLPCIMSLFIGPWQDKTGRRKLFIITPIIGQIIACISSIMNVYFFDSLNMYVLLFADALVEGLSGATGVIILSVFSFISTITTEKSRTFRMGIVNFCFTVSFPVGSASSGFILNNLGYYGAFGISLSIHALNLLYNLLVLKDPPKTNEQKQHSKRGFVYFLRTFFDLSNVKDSIAVVFKNEPKTRRLRMIVLLSVVTILFGPMYGEICVMYMMTRYRFNWDEVKFSLFQTYNFIIHTVGTIFSITVFSKYLQWHDSMLGIISAVSKIAASFVYCFAPTEQIFYIAPAVEILNGTSLLALRSIVSKLVAPNELGRVNSIFGLTENLMPLVYVPLYTKVYGATMEVLPGAVFLMGAAMTAPAVVVFVCLFVEHRLGLKKEKPAVNFAEIPLTT